MAYSLLKMSFRQLKEIIRNAMLNALDHLSVVTASTALSLASFDCGSSQKGHQDDAKIRCGQLRRACPYLRHNLKCCVDCDSTDQNIDARPDRGGEFHPLLGTPLAVLLSTCIGILLQLKETLAFRNGIPNVHRWVGSLPAKK